MIISKRLMAVASAVAYETAADIGCDHGLTLIYLCKKNKIKKGIACDIRKQPLSHAENNIKKYGCGEIIETRLSDGLSQLRPEEAETLIIAGVGGMLAVKILTDSEETARAAKQLIIQPQLDVYVVRRHIHKLGFTIENEELIYEDGIYYNILNCLKGAENIYSEAEYMFGKILIERRDPTLKSSLGEEIEQLGRVAKDLRGMPTEAAALRCKELDEKIKIYKEVFNCL